MNELVVGHGSSRPLSAEELRELANFHLRKEKAARAEKERKEKLKGYRFWCSEGCGFVSENHRCEQWCHVTYISPELYEAIGKSYRGEAV